MPMRAADPMPLLTLELRDEQDVVLARQRARQLAQLLGFDTQEQTRIATAVSELARNAYQYAGGGQVRYELSRYADGGTAQLLLTRVTDTGPGIADLEAVLDGRYTSPTGMGLGLLGARRLSDHFRVESRAGRGTMVEIGRALPRGAAMVGVRDVERIVAELARHATRSPLAELRTQNQELLQTLGEVRARQAEIERLNVELEETNRGVLALYAELDDRAEDLRRASEYKSRFLSDIGHEFRTPLTAVLNLTRILLSRADGDLSAEQELQVTLIRRAVETLNDLVNDLLDLAKIEAGKVTLRHAIFSASDLLSALRGISRPLLASEQVALVFEERGPIPMLQTDEGRLQQVLRNFLSNAIKFTERGEIRVTAERVEGDRVRFAVSDTGIGIAPADQERIFHDFTQVDSAVQRRVHGTGLGLPLTRKLAALLGGSVTLVSEPGRGSTFDIVIPRVHPDAAMAPALADVAPVARRAADAAEAPAEAPAEVPADALAEASDADADAPVRT